MNGIFSDSSPPGTSRLSLSLRCHAPDIVCLFFKKNKFLFKFFGCTRWHVGILVPEPGIKPACPAVEAVLTTRPSGRSHCVLFFQGELTFAREIHSHPDATDTPFVAPAGSPTRAPHLDLDPHATSNPGSPKPCLKPSPLLKLPSPTEFLILI